MKQVVHVISHTHWDREWYLPFQSYRMMLVDNIDRVMGILETDSAFRAFHLDGQTVVLEDYLAIRPQNRERLQKLIQSGRILIGPFYLLNDQWLVSGEAIIRNLLLGRAICRDFGVEPMKVGYVADNFGHNSQVPQILAGFGLDNAILGRGITPHSVNGKSEFIWEGADGTRVLTHIMAGWYNSAYNFQDNPVQAVEYARKVHALLSGFASAPVMMGMDGCDHIFAKSWVPRMLAEANRALGEGIEFRHSTMREFMEALKASVPSDLTVYKGELREEFHATIVQGTFSARPEIKARNNRSQIWLERYAEPLSVMNWINGGAYDADFLWHAWRHLLQNHPHDSICGCSVNQIYKDMTQRFDAVDDIARNLSARGLQQIAVSLKPVAHESVQKGILLYNPCGSKHEGALRIKLLYPLNEMTGHAEPENLEKLTKEKPPFEPFELIDSTGRKIRCQIISRREGGRVRSLSPYNLPDQRKAVEFDLALEDVRIPALGHELLQWKYVEPVKQVAIGAPPFEDRPLRVPHVSDEAHVMDNEFLRVEINGDGTLNLTHKETGRRLERTHYYENGGEAGQSYDYFKPKRDEIFTTLGIPASIRMTINGPVLAEYVLRQDFPVPRRKDGDGRSQELAVITLETTLSLARGQRYLAVKSRVINPDAMDFRLRVMIPTDLRNAADHDAETTFDIPRRAIKIPEQARLHSGCWHMKSFVSVSDGKEGVAILNRSLAEYHVENTQRKEIGLTLLRATSTVFGAMWGTEGVDVETFGQGEYEHEYAICLHRGDWTGAGLLPLADSYQAQVFHGLFPKAVMRGDLPHGYSLIDAGDKRLRLTSLKRTEEGDGVIVRIANFSPETVTAEIRLGRTPTALATVRLDETEPWELSPAKSVKLTWNPKQIITLRAQFADVPPHGGKPGNTYPFTQQFLV
ncbi:glycoside hydrolase family 38 C-terminal domain-containing protein [Kamptonema cortianum]|uniref:Glycoside hydrolase family 38 C-terminal domain-containing protein n=1 Tax=Geitlerinema calcuttense NRMC-F 0142 TaxID=2922238 RepID=A0ABT7M0R5_9CYAN|nr:MULTISPECIES: glycoside hydrolase family 38 C-terminal domain-containing protein [Cyanophyceae]MDK3161889.1 glycoside hydrolase family 38 C-terminal domain-containing protein [Kamptonema cortianum]MDL5050566.1 glycoside hydrolase family 38 C-terminal domain-containing protein [Oscillatoria amoena NRMC-F 0135]MDL5055581.1 glycoside hydrolase family 38 C-terminal domain-containing protein [Oscillatoria laete-virens NRMC-F 0139]MDL5057852.1 glycoside hydrolase family 38 C-terminal domain-contai